MNARPKFAGPRLRSTFIASTLATMIAIGLLSGVAYVFQREGKPVAELTAVERDCTRYTHDFERDSCLRQALAAASPAWIADS